MKIYGSIFSKRLQRVCLTSVLGRRQIYRVVKIHRRLNAEHRLALRKQKEEVELKGRQLKLDEERVKGELRLKKKQYEIDEAKYYNEKTNREDDKKDELKDRIFKWSIGIAELMLPMMFYAIWMKRGFEFERTGTYTSTTFRGLFNNFKPVKK